MRFHKEGKVIITGTFILIGLIMSLTYFLIPQFIAVAIAVSAIILILVLQFFRNPSRVIKVSDNNLIYAPADGKVVVIEDTEEQEYFKDKRLQVSIFMSPINVHVNRNPVSGVVNYFKYHPGKYLVAWHPKSSTENERTTTVIDNGNVEILLRQIAGALAKRIINYLEPGDKVEQGGELGFIKFGSRVDLFLPLGTKVNVEIGQKVRGNETVIATLA